MFISPAIDWQFCDKQFSLVDNLYNTSGGICATVVCFTNLLYTTLWDHKYTKWIVLLKQ